MSGRKTLFIAIDDLNDWIGPLGGYRREDAALDQLAAGTTFSRQALSRRALQPVATGLLTGLYPTSSGIYKNHEDWRVAFAGGGHAARTVQAERLSHTVGGGRSSTGTIARSGTNTSPAWWKAAPVRTFRTTTTRGAMSWGRSTAGRGDERLSGDELGGELSPAGARLAVLPCLRHLPPAPALERAGELLRAVSTEEIVLPEVLPGDLDDVPAAGRFLADPGGFHAAILNSGNWAKAVQAYLACISFVDAQVGRLLDALDASPHADNTVIALWSDHGIHLGEKEHWHKSTLWEESGRPVDDRRSRRDRGKRLDTPIDLVNTYPTLADLCGLPIASEPTASAGRC